MKLQKINIPTGSTYSTTESIDLHLNPIPQRKYQFKKHTASQEKKNYNSKSDESIYISQHDP